MRFEKMSDTLVSVWDGESYLGALCYCITYWEFYHQGGVDAPINASVLRAIANKLDELNGKEETCTPD